MKRRIQALLTLPPIDLWVLAQAWTLLAVVDVGLRLLPLRRVQRMLAPGAREASRAQVSCEQLQRLVRAAADHHLYPMHCLQRSLVLQRLLSRRGIETELRFGVRKEGEQLHAHAWLERGGQPLGRAEQGTESGFAPLVAQ
jgi:hypothetical protein